MNTPRPPQAKIDLWCEIMHRVGNRTLAAKEAGVPKATFLRYTRHIPGSPLGGGFNPIHAHRHPERIVQADQSPGSGHGELSDMGKRLEREGREPIAVAVEVVKAVEPQPKAIDWAESGDVANVSFSSDKIIKTVEDALQYGEVDTSVWFVKSWKCGSWPTTMRLRNGQDANKRWLPDSGHVKLNWTVKLELARILPKPFKQASDAIFERLANHAPIYTPITRSKPKSPHLLEIDLFDCHFGKLAWRAETGQDYDLRLAAMVFRNAVQDLAGYAAGFEIDRILLPIGNDFYHVDTLNSTTTSGTHVDSDGRYAKIIECGELSIIKAIEYLRLIAPVSVIWVPGNHDRVASYHLARTVSAWFRQSDDVEVDLSPKVRKYFEYGKTLLGFSHGHQEPHRGLPMLMATEEPEAWARTTRREVHLGHLHHSRRTDTRAVGDQDGVSVRILQSLSGKDAYHAEKGFGGRRAAEAFLFSKDGETAANFQVSARDAA
jgi:hypothetical protein